MSNLCRSDTRSSPYAWLYHTMRGYTLNAWLYTFICTLAFHFAIYGYIHGYAPRCVVIRIFFTLKASVYTVLRTPTLTLHQIWLYVLLYHFMRGYTLNAWLYTFIYTLTFQCTACGYTRGYASWCTVIPVISRM